jgi:TP901 family phage tail tape measure protein
LSETLRDLVVSLSLNSDNFARNIRSVQKQIQEAQSSFKLASAGVQDFEKTAAGLSTKLETLKRTMSLQKDAVGQYERALQQAGDKLQECYARQGEYAKRLEEAKNRQAQLKQEVTGAARTYRQYSDALGETDSATIAAKSNLDLVKEEYRQQTAEVRKLEGQQVALKKSTQNAADAFSSAQTKLNGARAAVKQTASEITACDKALRLAQTSWDAAGRTIKSGNAAITSFGKQISVAESRFKLATAGIRDVDTSVSGLTARMTLLNDKLGVQQQALAQYENVLRGAKEQLRAAQQANDPEKTQQASDAVLDAEAALNRARAAIAGTRAEIEKTNKQLATARSSWTQAGKDFEAFGKKVSASAKLYESAGRALTTAVSTPVLAMGTAAIKASLDFESSFTSVRKTVDATEAEFDALASATKTMSTQVAASTTEINETMAIAGQLGIQNDYLVDFTRTMIDLGNSTNIVAEDAASTLAKFANITSMDQAQFGNLGATLVDLGNNFATTEADIMNMSLRLAAAGDQVGLSEAQILGFAAALSSVGVRAEMGGSAFSKALINMEVAAATGGQALEDFARVSGMTAEQFKALWDSDPAAAFQAFIVGLAQMDEEGISAIATLQEIGVAEIRLRDTLLRAVNANELFSKAQEMANIAWDENTALTEEANKRYATTESRLTNLKNTAVLFAQQIGDDLNPTIQELIDGANDLLAGFLEMDEAQRQQIVKMAAYAAAAGPVLLVLGKATKGIGTLSTGIGKFATAVGKAGGGWKGFFSTLSRSPTVWLAIAAATVTAAVAFADYISGAKQAREALESMNETADDWKNTAAETFYGSSEGLSFFGMSDSDFSRQTQSAQDWLDGLLKVWTDGEKETDEIVASWTESFKALTASTREELSNLKATADESGYSGVSEQLAKDIETLDSLDSEIESLLKKRQNGYFSDADQIHLQELIDTREAIEIKYNLTPADTDGFEGIAQKVEAEVARAQARGQSGADVSVYENAIKAAAEGMAAVNAELDAQYDKEYAVIQLIEDSAERQSALDALNARYNENRLAAAREYAQTLAGVVMPVWESDDIQQANQQVDTLLTKLREYSMAGEGEKPAILQDLADLSAEMDEGALTEYLGLLTQIQSLLDSGMSESEIQAMFPDIDVSGLMDQFAGVADYIDLIKTDLPGLYSMFNESLPEEVLKIATDLDMTGAQARWNEFAANPGAITTEAIITGYANSEDSEAQQPKIEAFITKYTVTDETDATALSPEGIIAYVTAYAEVTNGADVSGLTPENVTAMVAAYEELASGADVSALKPDEITAYISNYMEANGVDTTGLTPDGLTAFVLAYQEVAGGALTTALTPDDITAMVARYMEAEGVDLSALTPDQVEAVVSAYAEATGCDKSQLLTSFTAYITAYQEAEGVSVPQPQTRVVITGYDYLAYNQLEQNTDLELEVPVRLGELDEGEFEEKLSAGQVKYWQNGVEVPVDMVPENAITPDTVATLDADGTLHVLITPEITGTKEAVDAIRPLVDEVDQLGVTTAGLAIGLLPTTTMDQVEDILDRLESYNRTKDLGGWDKFWAGFGGETTDLSQIESVLKLNFDAESVAQLSAYVGELVAAIQQGGEISEEDLANLQAISEMLNGLDTYGIGAHVKEGVAQGMTEAGWATDAETVAANLVTALNSALGIQSPSTRMVPTGSNVAAGVGEGMGQYSFIGEAFLLAGRLSSAVSSAMPASLLRPAGLNAMRGLTAGINAGRSGVISAMRSAARAAVNAAKSELKIKSPSRVFEEEVGVMAMKGLGQGVLKESREQARVIRNAARYLTGEAKAGSILTTSNDNRRTYNQQSSISFAGSNFYINDRQDAYALAVEIAGLTRRQQRGRGLRMA